MSLFCFFIHFHSTECKSTYWCALSVVLILFYSLVHAQTHTERAGERAYEFSILLFERITRIKYVCVFKYITYVTWSITWLKSMRTYRKDVCSAQMPNTIHTHSHIKTRTMQTNIGAYSQMKWTNSNPNQIESILSLFCIVPFRIARYKWKPILCFDRTISLYTYHIYVYKFDDSVLFVRSFVCRADQ